MDDKICFTFPHSLAGIPEAKKTNLPIDTVTVDSAVPLSIEVYNRHLLSFNHFSAGSSGDDV